MEGVHNGTRLGLKESIGCPYAHHGVLTLRPVRLDLWLA